MIERATAEAKRIVASAIAANSREELNAIWIAIVGYDVIEESPDVEAKHIRLDLFDYARELCFDAGVHVSLIGIPEEASE